MAFFSNNAINPHKPNILFVGHRKTVQSKIRPSRTRYLIRVSTVCLQNVLLKFRKSMEMLSNTQIECRGNFPFCINVRNLNNASNVYQEFSHIAEFKSVTNIYLIINGALSTIDTLHFISFTSVHLTISNGVGKMPVSGNYFRDCVKYLFNQKRLIFEVVFSTTDN